MQARSHCLLIYTSRLLSPSNVGRTFPGTWRLPILRIRHSIERARREKHGQSRAALTTLALTSTRCRLALTCHVGSALSSLQQRITKTVLISAVSRNRALPALYGRDVDPHSQSPAEPGNVVVSVARLGLKQPKLSLVRQMPQIDPMASNDRQLSWKPYKVQCVGDPKGAIVEENMMVGAETQNVREFIGAIVRPSQRPNVCSLSIGTTGALQPKTARLAAVVMEALHPPAEHRIADDPLDVCRSPLRGVSNCALGRRCRSSRLVGHQAVATDLKTVSSALLPITFHAKEAVVAVSGRWRELTAVSRTSHYTDRQTFQ